MRIVGKGSKVYSIARSKCPRCQEGEVFKDRNPYNLSKMFQMHEHCSNCGIRYEFEPGVFYGAMYVSYAYSVAVFVATYLVMRMFYVPGIVDVIVALSLILVIGSPLIFRLSRITWMNFFIKYEPDKRGERMK